MLPDKSRVEDKSIPAWDRLKMIMAILRSEEGCSWDRKQTHRSLIPYLIEETYEVIEAVEADDSQGLKDELGDLLCQVVFHAQLADETGRFNADDAVESINEKLIRRHPHVFGESHELNPQQVRDQWERQKLESGEKKDVLSGLPDSMPALTMAFRVGEKAGGVGFDWEQASDVLDKLAEELTEIRAAMTEGDRRRLGEEIGDLLFATASLARKLDVDPELALKRALRKFRTRFARLEERVNDSHRPFSDYSLDELEEIWQEIKQP